MKQVLIPASPVEMRPAAILTLLFSVYIDPMRSLQLEHTACPSMRPELGGRDINRDFVHLKAWYIYSYSSPPANYLSIFHIPPGVTAAPSCLRLLSAKVRGLVVLRYNCPTFTELQRFTLYSEKYRGDTYQQMHNHRRLYKVYRRFSSVEVLATDGETYVVFYGCLQVHHRALIGLMFLVRADVYDRFTPPPGLVQLLWLNLSFNVTQHLAHSLGDREKNCDCRAALKHINRKILEGFKKEKAQQKARERIKEQFPIGIRNFFVCVFSFALALLCVNKLIDKYVFDVEY